MKLVDLPFENELKTEIGSNCKTVSVDQNVVLAESGIYMKEIPLVLNGSIRVYRDDRDLNGEILLLYFFRADLYDVHSGKLCKSTEPGSCHYGTQIRIITDRDGQSARMAD